MISIGGEYLLTFSVEIRWHGRGGHGIVSASNLLCEMAMRKGYYGLSIPIFGAERRGAPTKVYTRISSRPIFKRSAVTKPDMVVITDASLLHIVDPLRGLKRNGVVVINSHRMGNKEEGMLKGYKVIPVNAVEIAMKVDLRVGGIPVVTIPLMGGILKVLRVIDLDTAERVIRDRWEGPLGEKNVRALELAMEVIKA